MNVESAAHPHSETDLETRRKPYEAPRLLTIPIQAEQSLTVGCKMAAAAGPVPPTCLASSCSADGS